jgi:hypothetical protein
MARIRGRHPKETSRAALQSVTQQEERQRARHAHHHSQGIQCLATRFAFDLGWAWLHATHCTACMRFLACVVGGTAQQVQLARGAYVATEQATTHAQLQTSSRKPKKTRCVRAHHAGCARQAKSAVRARSGAKKDETTQLCNLQTSKTRFLMNNDMKRRYSIVFSARPVLPLAVWPLFFCVDQA